jgi:hypothetical protein
MGLVPEIDMLNFGVALNVFHGALGEEFSEVEDGDFVGDALDKFHVVLDNDQGAVFGDFAEEYGGAVALGRAHSGNGLIQHEEFRFLHEQHPDFEPLFLPMAEDSGWDVKVLPEVDGGSYRVDAVSNLRCLAEGDAAKNSTAGGVGDFKILKNGQVFVNRRGLEFASDPSANNAVFLHAKDVAIFESNASRRGAGFAADEVEESCFAGAVRANDNPEFVAVDVEAQVVDGFESIEGDREFLNSKKVVCI